MRGRQAPGGRSVIAFILAKAPTVTASQLLADYIGVFFASFVVCFAMTPILRRLAVKNGIIDVPDLQRKNHLEPVAYLGGVGIFFGWLAGLFVCYFMSPIESEATGIPAEALTFPLPVVFGATVITLTGLIDDVYGVSPRVKIGGQLMAAAALAWSSQNLGTKLVADTLAWMGLDIPWGVDYFLGAVLLAVFVVGGCNSLNLLDGLDGLAAGIAAIACVGFLVISMHVFDVSITQTPSLIDPVRIVMSLALLGALLGFLPYNFNPAHIFMGDAGSLLLGYLCVSIILSFAGAAQGGPRLVMAALIVFALPITDTSLAIFRRLMRGQSVLKADNEHIHHEIFRTVHSFKLGHNTTVKLSVLSMYALAVIFGVLGCSLVYVASWYVPAVFLAMYGFIIVAAYKSGRRRVILDSGASAPVASATRVGTPESAPESAQTLIQERPKSLEAMPTSSWDDRAR